MKIRIKFSKHGAMKFIGHLDIMRFFQKAMRRAGVNIRYSEGFSPHQIMSFAAPLGVGLTSNGEYLDIEVTDDESASPSSEEMVSRLNQVMVEGIQVLSYRKLPDTAKNAMSIVAAADYTVCFRSGYEPEDLPAFWQSVISFLDHPSIEIVKKTKRGEAAMDLKPHIYEYRAEKDGLFLRLSAGSMANIKPELVLTAFAEKTGQEFSPFAFQVQREEVYADGMISLEDFGETLE